MQTYRSLLRIGINAKNIRKLENKNFSVISSNCVGGVILHELKLRFNSPTVNLFIYPNDYIKFLRNLKYYLQCELVMCESDKNYLVGLLDDIKINFMHYASFEEAKKKWDVRCKRINFDNLYIIMVQRDGCDDECVREFDALPYKNKVIFTAKNYEDVKSAYYLPNCVNDDDEVIDLCKFQSRYTGKRWLDEFDYVSFFNRKN